MPQAKSAITMSRLSRRGFLAGATPVAASLVLAGGTAVMAATPPEPVAAIPTPEPDPIFALIKRHRKAVRDEHRLHKIFQKHADDKEDGDHRGVVVGERPKLMQEVIRNDEHETHIRWRRDGEMEPIVVFNEADLAKHAPTVHRRHQTSRRGTAGAHVSCPAVSHIAGTLPAV